MSMLMESQTKITEKHDDILTESFLYNVIEAVTGYRYVYNNEAELQQAIQDVLGMNRLKNIREYRLSETDRIDFLLKWNIGIEIKTKGSLSGLIRQIHRYLHYEEVLQLIVVTDKSRLCRLPKEINCKRIYSINISDNCW